MKFWRIFLGAVLVTLVQYAGGGVVLLISLLTGTPVEELLTIMFCVNIAAIIAIVIIMKRTYRACRRIDMLNAVRKADRSGLSREDYARRNVPYDVLEIVNNEIAVTDKEFEYILRNARKDNKITRDQYYLFLMERRDQVGNVEEYSYKH